MTLPLPLPLPGDPASCSHAGGALRLLAARLRVTGRRAHEALDSADFDLRGREGDLGRRLDRLDAAAAAVTAEVDEIGRALQTHALDLAEAQAAARLAVPADRDAILRALGPHRHRLLATTRAAEAVLEAHAGALRR